MHGNSGQVALQSVASATKASVVLAGRSPQLRHSMIAIASALVMGTSLSQLPIQCSVLLVVVAEVASLPMLGRSLRRRVSSQVDLTTARAVERHACLTLSRSAHITLMAAHTLSVQAPTTPLQHAVAVAQIQLTPRAIPQTRFEWDAPTLFRARVPFSLRS